MMLTSSEKDGALQTRRDFLKTVAVTGGGFMLGVVLPDTHRLAGAASSAAAVGVWIRIGTDESITIMVPTSEMGQGVLTSLPQLIAEELRCDWSKVRTEHAPEGTQWGSRLTGGSTSVRTRYIALRRAGAAARDMLVRAAAATWSTSADQCVAALGKVSRIGSTQVLSYGQLASLAATLAPSNDTAYLDSLLTADSQMRIIGKSVARPDIPSKVDGSAIFGIDIRLPGMLYAAVRHCPTVGGTLKSLPAKPTGAKAVVALTNAKGQVNAVAIVAGDTWSAMRMARQLKVSWSNPANASQIESSAILAEATELMASGTGVVAENVLQGLPSSDPRSADQALAASARRTEFTYSLPYLAHMTFEPLNCTALVAGGECRIWAPTQWVSGCEATGAAVTGLPRSAIKVTNALMGKGLGRKFEQDFVSQAVQIAKALPGLPIKLTWSREEDTANDQYRPMALCRVSIGLDAAGNIASWIHRIVSPGILYQRGTPLTSVDSQSVEGARGLHYTMGARRVEHVQHPCTVPVGFWRSVGSSINAFVVESAVDEVALLLGNKDPYQLRKSLLSHDARAVRVLDTAAQMAGWGRQLPAGRALGMAFAESFNTLVCQVVEISAPTATSVKLHKVWIAADVGKAVNPDTIKQQMEGGMFEGLSAALWGKITWVNGGTVEKNFNKSRKLRMSEMPACEVTVLETPGVPLGGVGEPGTPPIAPAVANAFARLTGIRLRTLPMFPTQSAMGDD